MDDSLRQRLPRQYAPAAHGPRGERLETGSARNPATLPDLLALRRYIASAIAPSICASSPSSAAASGSTRPARRARISSSRALSRSEARRTAPARPRPWAGCAGTPWRRPGSPAPGGPTPAACRPAAAAANPATLPDYRVQAGPAGKTARPLSCLRVGQHARQQRLVAILRRRVDRLQSAASSLSVDASPRTRSSEANRELTHRRRDRMPE